MTQSSFYHDGYRAGLFGLECSPPDEPIHAREYCDGYQQACEDMENEPQPFQYGGPLT